MSTQPTSTSGAQPAVVYQRGPSLLVRFIWWLLIGWWASGIAVGPAWVGLVTIIGIPLGIWIINRLPSILTLRPRTRTGVKGLRLLAAISWRPPAPRPS